MVPCHIVQQGEKRGVCPIWNEVRAEKGPCPGAQPRLVLIRIYRHGPCIIISDLGLIRSPRFAFEEVVTAHCRERRVQRRR